MHYIVGILLVMMALGTGIGYWYYNESQDRIQELAKNNAQLEVGIETNEGTIKSLQEDYGRANQAIETLNQELREIRRQNQRLVEKFEGSDIGALAEQRPELIERLINRGTENAFRCFELLSGAELNEDERNAIDGMEFNPECPWLFDDYVR